MARKIAPNVSSKAGISSRVLTTALAVALDKADMGADGLSPQMEHGHYISRLLLWVAWRKDGGGFALGVPCLGAVSDAQHSRMSE